jgi:hypothetical protein
MPALHPTAAARLAALKAPPPCDVAGALRVLFPDIDLVDDVEILNEGEGPRITRWNRPEPQPTEARLRAVVVPPPILTLTARQARLWLLSAGLDGAAVRAQIDAMPEAGQREAAAIEWEYATEIRSDHPLVLSIASGLGLGESQLRAAFQAGAAL